MVEGTSKIPEFKEQKDKITKISKRILINQAKVCLIDNKWYKQWKKYVGYDDCEAANVRDRARHPGPIDNSPLLKDVGSGDIEDHLLEELDYVLLPKMAWNLLVKWYGLVEGQQPIVRKVVEYGMLLKDCWVEIYLLEFKLCSNRDLDHVLTKKFSRFDTIGYIEQEMRTLFNILPEQETKLWIRYGPNTYEHLSDRRSTVEGARLYHGQVLIIEERNHDWSWPKEAKRMVEISSNIPALEKQKDKISEISKRILINKEKWCLIDNKWYKQWKKYVGCDDWETANVRDRARHPGPINNSPLLKDVGSGDLKDHLLENLDYVLLPEEAWNLLVRWYGLVEGQQPIVRKVVECGLVLIIEERNANGSWPRQVKSSSAAISYTNSTSTGSGDKRTNNDQPRTRPLNQSLSVEAADPPQQVECSICFKPKDIVKFEPCGHKVCCEDCCMQMEECLICDAVIEKKTTADRILSKKIHQGEERVRHLENKLQEMEEANRCSICLERPRNVAFMCGHGTCGTCAQKLKTCHMCRKKITKTIILF